MLKLEKLNVVLGEGSQLRRHVIKNLDLEVKHGEFVIIIGSNGAGKSTLFNAISGTTKLKTGKIKINNSNITKLATHERSQFIAKVMQNPEIATIDNMTIEENLSFAYMRGKKRRLSPHLNENRIFLFKEKLSLLEMGLEHRLFELTSSLSGGQRQALSLIMAIIANSEILLLDEITAALDPKTAELIMKITAKIVKETKHTTLMITHNMSHALEYGDRTILMSEGKIIAEYGDKEKVGVTDLDLAAKFSSL
jgi:putative tryptophan/tyrosine transport system ATP-binding protein